ncbi:DUF3987 domain-containing protein, partial [Dapis sp. BLCC M172]|uniref:DUF3987 domain-containing protein n=1 Tax=Dapis sp. BLCC M172 TaxID=2975281 RepID=UPI003CF63C29
EECLSKNDRALINGGEGQNNRNNAGAKLARGLIGAAKSLDHLGYSSSDPRQLFDDYCSRCTPPLDIKEANRIWRSAEKSNPTSTLTDDALENCIKKWREKRESKNKSASNSSKVAISNNIVEFPAQQSQQWELTKVEDKLSLLAGDRPTKTTLTKELKKLSQKSGWTVKDLRSYYQEILEERDKAAELEDDIVEFGEILSSNEPLPCEAILPKELRPILKFAENLGVNPEPALVALEATAASLIHPETRIIGRKCSDFEEVPTTFSAIVGEPGSKKSPIINAIASKPLGVMEKEATEQYNAELAEYEKELAEWESADKQDRGDKPTPPKRRQYFTGDYTPEALREIAQDNPKILRLFDELAREANSRGRYTSGKGGEAQQLLESYNGYLPPMNRKGKHYPSLSANQSLLGGIQPDVLSNIMSSADPTGEFARYNIATLNKKPHFWNGDSEVSININPLLVGIYEKIDELPSFKFNLTPEAYALFEKYHNKAETKANEETKPALIYQYSKADGKILRWALLYHILEAVANGQTPSQTIGKRPLQIAAHRMRYQINQVRATLARMENNEPSKLLKIYNLALRKNEEITAGRVKKVGHVKEIDEAIEHFRKLEAMGYGKVVKTKQTHKFEAFPERKTAKVAVGGSKVAVSSVNSSNGLEPSISLTPGNKGG